MHAERPQLDSVSVDGFEEGWLAGLLIDGPDGNVVLAAAEHLLSLVVNDARIAVRLIDEASIGMDVDRARTLAWTHIARVAEARLHEPRRGRELPIGLKIVEVYLVLPLDRDIDPRFGRMEIQMARAEAETGAGPDRLKRSEDSIVETEDVNRTRVLRFRRSRVIASRNHDHALIRGHGANLVRVDSRIKPRGLVNQLAQSAIRVDPVNG